MLAQVGSIPHPVMGTTRDYCRYIKALLSPYSGAITRAGIDLRPNWYARFGFGFRAKDLGFRI